MYDFTKGLKRNEVPRGFIKVTQHKNFKDVNGTTSRYMGLKKGDIVFDRVDKMVLRAIDVDVEGLTEYEFKVVKGKGKGKIVHYMLSIDDFCVRSQKFKLKGD